MDDHEINIAHTAAAIIMRAAERLTKTSGAVMRLDKATNYDFFWVQIIIGIDPFDVNRLVWADHDGTRYAHIFRLRVPMTLATVENYEKLRQIGNALADIWWESRNSQNVRTDRQYIIPHIGQYIWGTRTLDSLAEVTV